MLPDPRPRRSYRQVADLILAEIAKLGTETPTPADLAPRRATLIGGFGRSLETVDGLGTLVANLALYDLPMSDLADYAGRVRAVTPEQIQQLIHRFIDLAAGIQRDRQIEPGLMRVGIGIDLPLQPREVTQRGGLLGEFEPVARQSPGTVVTQCVSVDRCGTVIGHRRQHRRHPDGRHARHS